MTQASAAQQDPSEFFAVPTTMLLPDMSGSFGVYIRQEKGFVLYAHEGEQFTPRHRLQLRAHGVEHIYVHKAQHPLYREHRELYLGTILSDETIPLPERARLFYATSTEIVQEVFERKLPRSLKRATFDRILALVTEGISFLTLENSLKTVASLVAHDYHTYSHSLHVFVYSQAILQSYGFDEESLVQFGLGAMLHDIGKTYVNPDILAKPGTLSPDERTEVNRHPVFGVGACTLMPLSQDAINCILFHHEKLDGSGYPCGLTAGEIPLPVRAITIADIYDALTSNRPYAPAMNAFQVLRLMMNEMRDQIDLDIFKRFVMILSGANVV